MCRSRKTTMERMCFGIGPSIVSLVCLLGSGTKLPTFGLHMLLHYGCFGDATEQCSKSSPASGAVHVLRRKANRRDQGSEIVIVRVKGH